MAPAGPKTHATSETSADCRTVLEFITFIHMLYELAAWSSNPAKEEAFKKASTWILGSQEAYFVLASIEEGSRFRALHFNIDEEEKPTTSGIIV